MSKKKDFLSVIDFSLEEIWSVFDQAEKFKKKKKSSNLLKNKQLAMIFSKSSTRTRVSFEVGMSQLGGKAIFLNKNDIQLKKGESIYDTAKVLSRYVDGIMIRTFDHEDVTHLAGAADIPVINGLTDLLHPCQAMTDFFTIYENKHSLRRHPHEMKISFIGDGNNVASSLALISSIMGVHFTIATPKGYEIPKQIVEIAQSNSEKSGAKISFTNDLKKAAKDADVLYTDVWVSMGQEEEQKRKEEAFKDYQINDELLKEAKTDVIVLHCLPARRGLEITDEIMDGPHSRVFDQAENRLHVQKAILAKLMK